MSPVLAQPIGYCTNVHAGATLEQTLANLDRHATEVKAAASPLDPMGVGLWLSAEAVREVLAGGRAAALRSFLEARGLRAYTFNGFPYGDFHRPVVKHDVYEPTWAHWSRARYTIDLATILAELIDEGESGSISTLPLAWRGGLTRAAAERARRNLVIVAEQLARLEERTGRHIHVDLEPEPGCVIEDSGGAARWFVDWLLPGGPAPELHRHLGVCHDVCHAAVMHDDQQEALGRYRDAGIRVGKVQVSSALRLDTAPLTARQRAEALDELGAFAEERYLHQTTVRRGGEGAFFDDLPEALASAGDEPGDEWRVHFHVPIDQPSLGRLGTTRDEIDSCLAGLEEPRPALEVETYAWDVLPAPLAPSSLAEGIARELRWLHGQLSGERRP